MDVSTLLAVLADLAPAPRAAPLDIRSGTATAVHFPDLDPDTVKDPAAARLAALDALHRDERIMRQGWYTIRGNAMVDGRRRVVFLPLYQRPVRIQTGMLSQRIRPAGDIETTLGPTAPESPLNPIDPETLLELAVSTGLPVTAVTDTPPTDRDELVLVTGSVLFAARPAPMGVAPTLRDWGSRPGLDATALAAVYGLAPLEPERPERPTVRILPLDPDQTAAADHARRHPVTVISGAPGCGKSHTLAAIAQDAIAAGESVLMVTQSVHAADVLADLISRQPGPEPVLFGDSERRGAVLTELSGGAPAGHGDDALRQARASADRALQLVGRAESVARTALADEHLAATVRGSDTLWFNDFPGLLDMDVDLTVVARLLDRSLADGVGWINRLRAAHARRRLAAVVRGSGSADDLRHALTLAESHRAAARLTATGGTDLRDTWDILAEADERSREAAGHALAIEATSRRRRDRVALRAMSGLAAALRAGRSRRRTALAALDTTALLRALPLWIGTVTDVDDILPADPGMFDLVILDESSHIDQIRAAPALARGRRVVVAGDPRQLRFVSFVGDAAVADVLNEHAVTEHADLLDVRRRSLYDVACGASPAIRLGEHYRGVPHLIGFSSRSFYNGQVAPVTTHPRNDRHDAIDVHRVVDATVTDGVNTAELERMLALTESLIDAGESDIALITPFRAQADAIEAALLQTYTADLIARVGLRTGTVHAFQGSEAATVIAGLGVLDTDAVGRRRFVSDPHLFNVMITRARRRLHVVTSLLDPGGLIGDFLRYADHPPEAPPPGTVDAWVASVSEELRRADVPVRVGYPVGSWRLDLCVGDGDAAIGVTCGVHPDGVTEHLARQRVLRRAGWHLVDAFASRYGANPVPAALAILSALRSRST
ncbi:AAA domain-containing protein [Stackebrandtia soli]|uniref:AAA domain-containing protein n=1 Tax=Stackebrandtia soli TaxID=1892856 RepID=UPI0039E9B13D